MSDTTTNDNEHLSRRPNANPGQGQAAILLVESLIYALVSRRIMIIDDAVEVVGIAVDVATELEASPSGSISGLTILRSIQTSLSRDLPNGK